MKKKHLENNIGLHPDVINWEYFLETHCRHVDSDVGYRLYNDYTNGFYFVDPEGYVYIDYGYNAKFLWNKLKGERFFTE